MAERPDGVLAVAYGLCVRCMGTVRESHRVLDRKLRARYHIVEEGEQGNAGHE
jgi:hypothetical protein